MYGTLRRVFAKSSESATATATATTSASASTNIIKSFIHDLSNLRDLDLLVHNFKQASQHYTFRANHAIYERTVRRLFLSNRFKSIEEILEHQKNFKEITKEGFSARIITLYGKSGMSKNARKTFDEMPQRNCPRTVLSLNALLGSYLHANEFHTVHTLFNELPMELSLEPNLVTYNTVIKAFCEMGSVDSAISMLEEMERKGVKPDLITFNTLLDGLYSKGRFKDGDRIWKQMEGENVAPNVKSYNTKLLGMCLVKKTSEAVELYEKMRKECIKPNMFSINALIKGFVNEDDLEEAKKWYSEIARSGSVPDKYTFAIILPFLCGKGDLKAAFEVSKDIFNGTCRVVPRRSLLQLVVDKLVNNSMISEAEEILNLANANPRCRYNLKLPQNL